ncbi:MAG: alpha/beta fold hydrolase [Burkholderiales bacterium]
MEIGHKLMGEGATRVLVLHGWLGDQRIFEPMLDSLNLESFTYAFMDYRGYGCSKELTGAYTMDEVAGDAFALADTLGWGWFYVVGHCMGGMVAQHMMADDPDRARAAVVIAPVPACGMIFDEDTWALFQGAVEDPLNRAGIFDHSTGRRLCATWLDAMAARSVSCCTREAFAAYLEAWMKTDFSKRMQGMARRMKVLVGEHDPAMTPKLMSETILAWNPRADMEILPSCGHYPMLETPVYLATVMERALNG